MVEFYHFIHYSALTTLSALKQEGAVVCFDLEDAIQDIQHPENNCGLKAQHRDLLRTLLQEENDILKTGIRINAIGTEEFNDDLCLLKELKGKIHTIFLPKINDADTLRSFLDIIDSGEISCEELIPVIECRGGMENIAALSDIQHPVLKGFAFGHCDYNLSIGNFPFFHSWHREYWTWIEYLASHLRPKRMKLIHSPLLLLEQEQQLRETLDNLKYLCGDHFSQITLSRSQNAICTSYRPKALPHFRKYADRHHLGSMAAEAIERITVFEAHLYKHSFAVEPNLRELISPQEYQAAVQYISDLNLPSIHLTFAGGCFPVQGNIRFENRFHQLLQKKVEEQNAYRLETEIIRYELLRTCLDKIVKSTHRYPADVLVFCFRPEPLLRLTKLYYRYRNKSGKIKRALQWLRLQPPAAEQHDLLTSDPDIRQAIRKASTLRKFFININYLTGYLLGNFKDASERYLHLMRQVEEYCKVHNIRFIVMGPSIRSGSTSERWISEKFAAFIRASCQHQVFIDGQLPSTVEHPMYLNGGVYVSENYHYRISEELFERLLATLSMHASVKSSTMV